MMETVFNYLVRVSAGISLVYLFYYFVLRLLTFYQWNRIYLISHSILCFLLPLLDISAFIGERETTVRPLIDQFPVISFQLVRENPREMLFRVLGVVLVAGIILLLMRILLQYVSVLKMRRSAKLIHAGDSIRLYHTEKEISPFSFGRSIFINSGLHSETEMETIILHEIVHVRERHTIDLLISELLCIVNWYNPFAWLLRRSIRQNLEFVADSRVLAQGQDMKSYQYFLLKAVGQHQFSVVNHFSFSNLKSRIIMMNKMKSTRINLGRFLFAVPMLAFILLSFRTQWVQEHRMLVNNVNPASDTTPVIRPAQPEAPEQVQIEPVAPVTKIKTDATVVIDQTKPLIVLNGIRQPVQFDVKDVNAESIVSVTVRKDTSATKIYGADGRNGVVEMVTRDDKGNAVTMRADTIIIPEKQRDESAITRQNQLVILNGVRQKQNFNISTDLPGDAVYMNVLDSIAGLRMYGDEGRNGVIIINTGGDKSKNGKLEDEKQQAELDRQNSMLRLQDLEFGGQLAMLNQQHLELDRLKYAAETDRVFQKLNAEFKKLSEVQEIDIRKKMELMKQDFKQQEIKLQKSVLELKHQAESQSDKLLQEKKHSEFKSKRP